jgi:hypothetical protein
VKANKFREEFLVFLRRNHQREEIDDQESGGGLAKPFQPSNLPEK